MKQAGGERDGVKFLKTNKSVKKDSVYMMTP
jgi:hypothetical protein